MSFGTFKGFYVYSYMIRWRIVLVSRCIYWFMGMSVSACMNSWGLGLLETFTVVSQDAGIFMFGNIWGL